MLRIPFHGNSMPISVPVSPSDEFQAGMVAQLKLEGNQIVCGVSDGTAPFGIIDDTRVKSFSSTSIDEVVIAPVNSLLITTVNGQLVTTVDIKVELENPNILPDSFISKSLDVELIARNGVVVFLAGTVLNMDMNGDGIPDSVRTVVSYTYQVPNVPGDDTTIASGRMTVWLGRMIASTDQFDTSQTYPLNSPLFSSEAGLLTTRPVASDYPAVAMVTGPPGTIHGFLEFMYL